MYSGSIDKHLKLVEGKFFYTNLLAVFGVALKIYRHQDLCCLDVHAKLTLNKIVEKLHGFVWWPN